MSLQRRRPLFLWFAINLLGASSCVLYAPPAAGADERTGPQRPPVLVPRETVVDPHERKEHAPVPLMTCGKCPEGYVKTAVAAPEAGSAPGANFNATAELCKGTLRSEDATLVECKPIGFQDQMPVCGACPEGYREVGRTFLPALCGNEDGGLRTQCQLPTLERGFPDPTKGGIFCPPNCPGPDQLPTPGQGLIPFPPKIPSIGIRKEKPDTAP
jgi:hypothetical protein